MSIKKNMVYMASSTGVRIGFGMLTFVILARCIGPVGFGHLMLWVSISTLINFLTNFGMTSYILRHSQICSRGIDDLLAEAISAKVILSLLSLLIGLATFFLFSSVMTYGFIFVLLALMLDSWTELLNVFFRAGDQYSKEAGSATLGAVSQLLIIAIVVIPFRGVEVAALAFLLSRCSVFIITLIILWRSGYRLAMSGLRAGGGVIKNTASYAFDYFLQNLFGQIDSVVINFFGGPALVGLYQSGLRIFLGGAQAAGVLVNVFVPRIAAASKVRSDLDVESNKLQLMFLATGFIFGCFLCFLPLSVIEMLFGHAYRDLYQLMPFFGILFFVRFLAAAFGVILTSIGEQNYRTWINVIHWMLIAVLSPWLVPQFGPKGWLLSLLASNLFLAAAYYIKSLRFVSTSRKTYAAIVCSSLFFAISFFIVQVR
jgi:O-antigen/teichoic acid export membrane protein